MKKYSDIERADKMQKNFMRLKKANFVTDETNIGGRPQPNRPLIKKLRICGRTTAITKINRKLTSSIRLVEICRYHPSALSKKPTFTEFPTIISRVNRSKSISLALSR